MSNPLYSMMGGGMGNMSGLMNAVNNLKRQFNGDPQQMIQQMLNSGRVTQDQYNRAMQMAQQIQSMLK